MTLEEVKHADKNDSFIGRSPHNINHINN